MSEYSGFHHLLPALTAVLLMVPLDLWQLAFVIAAAVAIPFVLRLLSALERRILKTGM